MKRICRKTRKHLVAFQHLQLEEEKARQIEEHLARCPLCKKEAERLGRTWDLLGSYSIEREFPDLTPGIFEKMAREDKKYDTSSLLAGLLLRIPAPALALLTLIIAIPPGTLLGKNLYLAISTTKSTHLQEGYINRSVPLPLDIFADFPQESLGTVYMNLVPENSREE